MKKFSQFIINMFFCIFTFSFIACELSIDDIPRQIDLESISLDTTHVLTEYAVGTPELNTNGLRIIGHYSDNSEKEEDIGHAIITGFDSTNEGVVKINVEFNGQNASYEITIGEDVPVSLKIKNYPKKKVYWLEDIHSGKIDYTGLEVQVIYKSGKVEDLDSNNVEKTIGMPSFNRTDIRLGYLNLSYVYYTLFCFNKEYFNGSGIDSSDINDFISFEEINHLEVKSYVKGEEINFNGLLVQIKDYKDTILDNFPIGECYIDDRIVSDDLATKKYTTAWVNETPLIIDFDVIDSYVTAASVDINMNNYIKQNYQGNSLNFTDSNLFTFTKIYNNNNELPIVFTNGELPNGESIKYSVGTTPLPDNELKTKGIDIKNPIPLTTAGKTTVYFYYTFNSKKLGESKTEKFYTTLYIQDPKYVGIEVAYNYSNNNTSYIMYDENTLNNLLNNGAIRIIARYTDTVKNQTITTRANRDNFKINIPDISFSDNDLVSTKTEDYYIKNGTVTGTVTFKDSLNDTIDISAPFSFTVTFRKTYVKPASNSSSGK